VPVPVPDQFNVPAPVPVTWILPVAVPQVIGFDIVPIAIAGKGLTLITDPEDAIDEHPPVVALTVYVPAVETVIDCVVAPVDHRFPVEEEDVNTTEPPAQNEVELPAVIVGADGAGLTVTAVPAELADEQPVCVTATEYVPEVETVMDCVVAPVDHKFPDADEDVKTTEPPAQKVVEPPAEIVGVAGIELIVTEVPADVAEEHPDCVTPTV
jgi:hypothetical protein